MEHQRIMKHETSEDKKKTWTDKVMDLITYIMRYSQFIIPVYLLILFVLFVLGLLGWQTFYSADKAGDRLWDIIALFFVVGTLISPVKKKMASMKEQIDNHITTAIKELKEDNKEIKANNKEIKADNKEIKANNKEIKADNKEIKADNKEIKADNKEIKGPS